MDIKKYCQKISEYKDKPMTIIQYFGVRYVVIKILILAFATFILSALFVVVKADNVPEEFR